MIELDSQQRRTLLWAGLAVTLAAFDGSVLILALPAVANDFNARVPALANLGSVLALGAIGALPLSTLADRFGRRRLIAIGVAGFSAANLASAFAPSLIALGLIRLVAVVFESLVGAVATALIVEEAPPGRRGQAVSALAVAGGVGAAITVLAYPLVAPHWRSLFAAGGIGLLAVPFVWRGLPEGRTWQRVGPTRSALRVLLGRPWLARAAVIACFTALTAVLLEPAGLFFTLFASRDLHMSPGLISAVIVASGVVGFTCYLAGGYITDRFVRRLPGVVLTAGTAIATGLSFVTGTAGFVVGNVMWSALASASTPVFGAWSGELFPTRARATAESLGGVSGAIGAIAGLQLVGFVSESVGLGRAIEVAAAVALGGAGLILLLPETKGAPLPE